MHNIGRIQFGFKASGRERDPRRCEGFGEPRGGFIRAGEGACVIMEQG